MVGITSTIMFPPCVVESPVIEISGVVSVEKGAIVIKVSPVAIVTVPDRIIIISISGEVCFTYCRSGVVASCVHRSGSGCVDYGCRNSGAYINPGGRQTQSDMRTDHNLRITFAGDEAGGYNGG